MAKAGGVVKGGAAFEARGGEGWGESGQSWDVWS